LKLVLDTNIYADYAEGLPQIVDLMATRGEQIFIPSIVVGELYYDFIKGRRQGYNEKELLEIIDRLQVEVIQVNGDVARKYALIYLSLRREATKIPINDVWIAACCMEVGGTLLTRDKYFKYVEQIDSIVLNHENTKERKNGKK
jgi:predicted nucleic acid-binding protein